MIFIATFVLSSYKTTIHKARFGKIEGNIFETISKEQMLFCNVLLQGTSHKTMTDMYGHFVLDSIVPGKYTLCAFELGYDTLKVELEVKSGQRITKDFYLEKYPIILTTDPIEDKIPR